MRGSAQILVLVILLAGCNGSSPDLAWLYGDAVRRQPPPPVIIIPGILGSQLRDSRTGREQWPGNLARLLLSDYRQLALRIDARTLQPLPTDLRPDGLFEGAAGRDFYGAIIVTLEQAAGYVRGAPGTAVTDDVPRYYILAYDWRQDNVQAARALQALITQVRADHGRPDMKVDVIAHSMGGLVARYFLRYGTADVLDDNSFPVTNAGAVQVRRLALLGTPNLGSVSAMISVLDGHQVGLRKLPPEVLYTMPSVYQLFPHALTDWLITVDGKPLARDQFDAKMWQRFQFGPWQPSYVPDRQLVLGVAGAQPRTQRMRDYVARQLERARRFTWSLTVPARAESQVALRVFGGNCAPTPARLLVEEIDGESVLRLWPQDIAAPRADRNYRRLMLEPGDGAVTKASLLARDALNPAQPRHRYIHSAVGQAFFLCEDHERLTGNVHFQDNLLDFLLSQQQ